VDAFERGTQNLKQESRGERKRKNTPKDMKTTGRNKGPTISFGEGQEPPYWGVEDENYVESIQ